jgi:hypothetical protein
MATTVSSMPDRPLTKREVLDMEAREYCIDPAAEEAYAIILFGDEQVHALGLDPDTSEWVQFASEQISNSGEEYIDAFEESIYEWADDHYADRLGDDGDLKMSGPDDPSTDSDDGERERPREVEMGLEPEYDCPDCDYYKTGLTTAPQSFLDHLEDEHGYSRSEAHEILNR